MAVYEKENTQEISFPLGGIGTGSIGLAGDGRLRDWEIFNHPYKNTSNGFSHMMVRAEKQGETVDVRALHGDWQGQAIGGETENIFRGNGGFGYGMGPYRGTMAGVPHFKNHVFKGEYPFAEIHFSDEHFPGEVVLKAFSPFIPINDQDSSLPLAFFEMVFTNTTKEEIDYTGFFTLNNPLPFGTTTNRYEQKNGVSTLVMGCDQVDENHLKYGNLCLSTNASVVSYQEYWYRAIWFDSLESYWADVNRGGKLKNRSYPGATGQSKEPYQLNGEDHGTLAAHVSLKPGEKKSLLFAISWYFPNCANTWNPEDGEKEPKIWKNYYTKLGKSAQDFALYAFTHHKRLKEETLRFKKALYETTLPDYCIEAVSANLSILKTATCLRLENGEFYGFEGSGLTQGVCEGSCSHVWNYAYALPYLFPKLERTMRDLDFTYNQREDGAMSFRLMLPLGRQRYDFRPCVDGQMGGVIKAWREYLLCGDRNWLAGHWEAIKKSIEFAWADTNEDGWDQDRDGVMEGRQHHTMDMELYGPNSWLNGFYLAALLAGSKIAEVLGKKEEAQLYSSMYEKGKKWSDEHLFNGEYFYQKIDLKDQSLLLTYDTIESIEGDNAIDAYWNEETGEIKYQIGQGCATDQVLAQWHANLCGLGEIFDKGKTRKALGAIYKYNRVKTARNAFNAGRLYALDDESAVRICAWPQNVQKPSIPLTYADEVFCGLEYQAAAHMVQEGMLEEGFAIVKDIRNRFNGKRRNPWNEFECGNNYARSMASYSLIPSISGFTCNLAEHFVGFDPKAVEENFSSFFAVDTGWGKYNAGPNEITLEVLYGSLALKTLGLGEKACKPKAATIKGEKIDFVWKNGKVEFSKLITVKENVPLIITL